MSHGPDPSTPDDLLGRLLAGQDPVDPAPSGRAEDRPTADVSVRPALPEDAATIGDLHARTLRATLAAGTGAELPAEVRDAVDGAALARSWRTAITSPPSDAHRVLSACAGPSVVGFAAIAPAEVPVPVAPATAEGAAAPAPEEQDEPAPPAGTVGEILALEVPAAHARSGHGSRLLAACVDLLREQGATRAQTWAVRDDESRTRFLSSAGFAPVGVRRSLDVGGAEVVEICWYAEL
ncbi:GNAT family N-acetyltransferase [Georgenia sp. 10Sc9-8]|uniref:GNAT family N-acetyltransferase n=1 Tax=Georgenia halotolerans TaxID=3028317 RepID=A0ABT5TVF4_9MICO|nr:GNAT family N-acetyltransferase [Georgenia halotolerans]